MESSDLPNKLLAGGIAGIVGTCCIYPIDYLKTRLQNQHHRTPLKDLPKYVHGIYLRHGLRGFYSGLGANLVGVTPEKAIKLTVNDLVRSRLSTHNKIKEVDLPWYLGMVAGGAAGACQILATTPMEMAKIQLQMLNNHNINKLQVLRDLGIRGLYRGFGATLIRDVPFSLILFPMHALLKNQCELGSLGAGIGAGALAALAVTPMDVVKTRLQTANDPTLSMLQVYKDILRKEGVRAFFKGSIQRCIVVAPLFGISLGVFDVMK